MAVESNGQIQRGVVVCLSPSRPEGRVLTVVVIGTARAETKGTLKVTKAHSQGQGATAFGKQQPRRSSLVVWMWKVSFRV